MDYIKFENIEFEYTKSHFKLKDINLDINKNEFTSIIGNNGSGKTTLGKLMCGILKPNKGKIWLGSTNLNDMSLGQVGKKIGYLFQNPQNQLFTSTCEEEIAFPLKFRRISKEIIDEKVQYLLKLLQLEHVRFRLPYKLSQGEKKRLAIAALLANSPEFLILDEPTTALDTKRKKIFFDILSQMRKNGIGIVVISHDKDLIDNFSDKKIKINRGEICEQITI